MDEQSRSFETADVNPFCHLAKLSSFEGCSVREHCLPTLTQPSMLIGYREGKSDGLKPWNGALCVEQQSLFTDSSLFSDNRDEKRWPFQRAIAQLN